MPAANVKKLAAETRQLIAEVEAGDTAHAAWVAIQDRVQRLYDGRTQVEVGKLVGKSRDWASDVLAWDAHPHTTPFSRSVKPSTQEGPRAASAAKAVLRDPEARTKVIESMTEDERLELADAALAPATETGEQQKRDRRTVRQERVEDPHEVEARMIRNDLGSAEIKIKSGISTAKDASPWPEEHQRRLLARIDRTSGYLDLLRLAISNGDGVDWDAELAKLTVEEEA